METVILAPRSGYHEVIDEERSNWVFYILECLDIDIEELQNMSSDGVFETLVKNNIDIVDYPDLGAVKISFGQEVIAEWGEPEFLMVKDSDDDEFYYKITIENWSIFDDEDEE